MKSNTSVKIDREEVKGLIKNFVESKYGKLDKVEITFHDDSSNDLTYVDVTFEGFNILTELEIHKTDKADKSPDDLQNLPPSYFMNPLLSNEDKLEVRLADLIKRVEEVEDKIENALKDEKTRVIVDVHEIAVNLGKLTERVEKLEFNLNATDMDAEVLEKRVEELVKEVGQGNQIVEGHSTVITKLTERVENNHNTAFILTARVSVLEDKIKKLEASNKQLDKHVNKLMSVRMDGILKDCNKLLNNGWIQDNEGYWSHLNLKSFNKCSVEGAIRIQNNWDEMAKEGNNSVSGKEDLAKRVEDLEKKLEDPIYIKAEWNDSEVGSGKEDKLAYTTNLGLHANNIERAKELRNKESGKIDQVEGFKKRLFLNGWKMNDAGYFSHDKLKGQDCILRVAMEIQEEWDKTSGLITEKMADDETKRNKLKKNEDVETDEAYLTSYGWNKECGDYGIIWVHPTIGKAINAKVAMEMQNDAVKKAREQERLESPYGFHSVNPLRTAQREKDSREKKAAEYLMSKGWTWDRKWFHPNIGSSSTLEGAMDMQKAFEKRDKIREEKNG